LATYPQAVERLIAAFGRLPGVGRKTAERYALHLLRGPSRQARELAAALGAVSLVTTCSTCRNLTESDPCPICADPHRDPSTICVVETPADLSAMESAGTYRGRYHVLAGGLDPLEGVGPEETKVAELAARVAGGGVREVIVATSPTVEGEATADMVARALSRHGVPVTRLGYGVPVGADLKYMDELTLSRSLESRRKME